MHRRSFLKTGPLAGLAIGPLAGLATSSLAGLALAACQTPAPAPATTPAEAQNGADHFDLAEATIDQLQQKMQQGALTARSLAEAYLKRIDQHDKKGSRLNAVIELNPDALAIADDLDRERKAGKVRGPLHGIPVLIKDNIDTGDKMMTTAGAMALEGNVAAQDAFIVGKLRAAGAVLLGKTNLSEWANFRSERSTSGWSSRGGQTHCPYILARNPSGSSAGTGSAVSANFCAIGIGTETNGSIVSPSSVNGLVGLKPTVGLWSRSGIIPISATQDTAGPMARTVKDAAILLGALAGADPKDPVTAPGKGHTDYTPFLTGNGLRGKRVGIEKSFLHGHEGVVALYHKAIDVLKKQGAEVVEVDVFKPLSPIGHAEFLVLQYEFRDGVNKYLAASPKSPMKTLADVIAFNKAHADKAMPFFQQETLESSNKLGGPDSPEYKEALAKVLGSRKAIDDLMHAQRLDALSAVTNGPACLIDLITGDYDTGFSFSGPAAMAGYPHITVPMGTVMGLPIGFSFVAGAYQEPVILDMAYAFEQAMGQRPAPGFEKAFPA